MTGPWCSLDEQIRQIRKGIQRKHRSVANDSFWSPMDGAAELERRAIVLSLEELVQASAATDAPVLLSELRKEWDRLYEKAAKLPGYVPF